MMSPQLSGLGIEGESDHLFSLFGPRLACVDKASRITRKTAVTSQGGSLTVNHLMQQSDSPTFDCQRKQQQIEPN
jgi:hypothetical protein